MKMLPKDYNKAVGEPFRVEDYRGAKLEMYYLDDRPDYAVFARRGRFSVWTSDGVNYRLFVDKGYYEAVKGLYQNEVNDIWLDFTNKIYGAQKKLSNFYMLINAGLFVLLMILAYVLQALVPDMVNDLFLYSTIVLFIAIFATGSLQQKKLKKLVEEENRTATNLIRQTIGENAFQEILDGQEAYYKQYFQPAADEEAEAEVEQIESENNEDGNNNE
ncbi:hypothetical protein JV173_06165 [Acholeplasma equirhinis]|uniref:hypothetical protein n=1 Tax=Acholeplasma equirhinis TaxID=555393 RepID=UPI00197AAFAC|nr:hypothetical protein [Acholeplasma equirhinis]MBN3491100.1 hypothetical protein [Acholeplasma equirhinis]